MIKTKLSLHFSSLPHVHLVALLTSNGESHNQRNKLFKIHLAVAVGVQVLHDFVNSSRVLLRLRQPKRASVTVVARRRNVLSRIAYPQKVGQLVLHQLPELSPAEGAAPTLSGGVTVEHFDERLHGILQVRRHVGWLQNTFNG